MRYMINIYVFLRTKLMLLYNFKIDFLRILYSLRDRNDADDNFMSINALLAKSKRYSQFTIPGHNF